MVKVKFSHNTKIRSNLNHLEDSNVIGSINKGVELNLTVANIRLTHTQIVNQEEVTSSTWYTDKNGWFYWAGATTVVQHKLVDYSQLLLQGKGLTELSDAWWNVDVSGIKIAVIDEGFNLDNPHLRHLQGSAQVKFIDVAASDFNIEELTFSNRTSNTPNLHEKNKHGTTCLGILGAKSARFKGLVPDAQFYLIKVRGLNTVDLLRALQVIQKEKVHVVSCSVYFPDNNDEYNQASDGLIETLYDNGTRLIMSLTNSTYYSLSKFYYPREHKRVIRVVSLMQDFIKKNPIPPTNFNNTHFAFPNTLLDNITDADHFSGRFFSSYATPLIAGLVAKLLAYTPDLSPKEIQQMLRPLSSEYQDLFKDNQLKLVVPTELLV